MQIQTTRFGKVNLSENDLVTFTEGLLGFSELRKFVLLDDPNDEIFAWLQSCEKPAVAFPILEPELFTSSYNIKLSKHDLEALKLAADSGGGGIASRHRIFSIITIPADVTQMTANLKAPIVINVKERLAKQIVAQENDFQIKFPVFIELQKRVVQNPQAEIKSHAAEWGVAIKLPTTDGGGIAKGSTSTTDLNV